MAKDKKKKSGKKGGKAKSASSAAVTKFKAMSANPLAADVVAAALVATAAALKDSNKARRFAAEAGDQLEKLSKEGAERGGAMWQLALDIGRRALEAVSGEKPAKVKAAKAKAAAKPKSAAKSKAAAKPKVAAKPKAAAKRKVAAKPKATAARKVAAKPKATATRKPAAKPKPKRVVKKA